MYKKCVFFYKLLNKQKTNLTRFLTMEIWKFHAERKIYLLNVLLLLLLVSDVRKLAGRVLVLLVKSAPNVWLAEFIRPPPVVMDNGEILSIEVLLLLFSNCDVRSSFSHRPLKRNFDLWEKKLLELFSLGTSTPRLKLKWVKKYSKLERIYIYIVWKRTRLG